MDVDEYIAVCLKSLEQIEGILKQMEKDDISKNSPAWDVLEEKTIFWLNRLEACAAVDPANNYLFTGDYYYWN